MHTLELAFRLYRRYEQVETIDNYYGLLALYGLCQAAKASGQAERMAECRALLAQYPEKAWPFPCNFACYRLGGHAQAWAMLTGLPPPPERPAGPLCRPDDGRFPVPRRPAVYAGYGGVQRYLD